MKDVVSRYTLDFNIIRGSGIFTTYCGGRGVNLPDATKQIESLCFDDILKKYIISIRNCEKNEILVKEVL